MFQMVATKAAKPAAGAGSKKVRAVNKELATGVYRYSKTVTDRKKAVWKFVKKTTPKQVRFFSFEASLPVVRSLSLLHDTKTLFLWYRSSPRRPSQSRSRLVETRTEASVLSC